MKKLTAILAALMMVLTLIPVSISENAVLIYDDADLLTTEEEAELYLEMAPIRAYCTPVFWTTEESGRDPADTMAKAMAFLQEKTENDSGVILVLDMANQIIALQSTDDIYSRLTTETVNRILSGTVGLAIDGKYAECARDIFREVLSVLDGTGNSPEDITGGSISIAPPAPENGTKPENRPETEEGTVLARLDEFLRYWEENDLDAMLTLCPPSWKAQQENPKAVLFGILQNRTPLEYEMISINGNAADGQIVYTLSTVMERHNGKPAAVYRMQIRMEYVDGDWYPDLTTLGSVWAEDGHENEATPTPPPVTDPNTVLYYNPTGGHMYHLDQNCPTIHPKYLPLTGQFVFSQVNDAEYAGLEPCNVCGAPMRDGSD